MTESKSCKRWLVLVLVPLSRCAGRSACEKIRDGDTVCAIIVTCCCCISCTCCRCCTSSRYILLHWYARQSNRKGSAEGIAGSWAGLVDLWTFGIDRCSDHPWQTIKE
ncbi:hypothetical protein F4781DRAFT_147793 [Annulohypoxylon bovei var. microspora]|nr:hypothetical protein F4781DRAFT_147793 [Annulohypoxylon bovei var. microspora]